MTQKERWLLININRGGNLEEFVTLQYEGKEIQLPVITGTEGEKAIDISRLRRDTVV